MDFLAPLHIVIAVQLYWFSLVFIGFVLIRYLQSLSQDRFVDDWIKLPLPIKFVISTFVGFSVFGVVSVVGYLFVLPSWWLAISYITAIVGASLWFIYHSKSRLLKYIITLWNLIANLKLLSPVSILLVILIIDYIVSLFIGGFLDGDALVHISKIRHLTESGFTLTDAYYGTVPETRHHVTLVHTLFAIPSWFGIDPVNSWFYSLAFLRLLRWLVIFYLAWKLVGEKTFGNLDRVGLSSLAALLGIALMGSYFVNYPSYFAIIAVAFLIISFIDLLSRKNAWLIVVASIVIALTHPLVAVATLLFIGLVCVSIFIFDRRLIGWSWIKYVVISSAFLMVTPLISYLLPNQMTDRAKNYGLDRYQYLQIGDYKSFMPDILGYTGINNLILAVISTIGIAVLVMYFAKDKSRKIVILCAVIFPFLTMYNPLFSALVGDILPLWAQARLRAVNVITLVSLFFGLFWIFSIIDNRIFTRYRNATPFILALTCILLFLLSYSFSSVTPTQQARGPDQWLVTQQNLKYQELFKLQQLVAGIEPGAVLLAEKYPDNFMLPAVANVRVIAITEENSTPAADMQQRTVCFDAVSESLDYGLLVQSHTNYVIARRDSVLHDLSRTKTYLKLINGNESHEVFQLIESDIRSNSADKCIFDE